MEESTSNSFRINFQCWRIFGIWPGKSPSSNYKYYGFLCLFPFLIVYNVLLTVNLFYTPLEVNLLIEELMFYFNELSIIVKVGTVIIRREAILTICDQLDSDYFKGNDKIGREIVAKAVRGYKIGWNLHAFLCHTSFFFGSIFGVLLYLLSVIKEVNFPVSKYHFLSTETREDYFALLYAYQLVGIYVNMMYNVNVDSFCAGLLFYAITQIKVLRHELRSLQWKNQNDDNVQEVAQIDKLMYCLRHYESLLKYCADVKDLFSLALFAQVATSSIILCSVLCALMFSNERVTFMLTFLAEMTLQIFVPALLGTLLTSESEQLVFAAYESGWVPRCESYKKNLKLFIERAKTPVVVTGMKLFKLNLETFVSIMKTAYSFIALVRSFQERS